MDVSITHHAPAVRAEPEQLAADVQAFRDAELVRTLIDAVPDTFLILNEHRQAVFANQAILAITGLTDVEVLMGMRIGEIFDCVHSDDEPNGCGTTEFCQTCGAVNAILAGLRNKHAVRECRILRHDGDALDLRVYATPLEVMGRQFVLFSLLDISDEKRRRVLERVFFHDVLNTASGLNGVSELLADASPDDYAELVPMVVSLSERLLDEIQAQRELSAAEVGELSVRATDVDGAALVADIARWYSKQAIAEGRQIAVEGSEALLHTDPVLVERVVGNLVKNALEASTAGQVVTVRCRTEGDLVAFEVHNEEPMPREVQLQIFQRSFSTKGRDRGIGTFSIKLLTERYLAGSVGFTSNDESGTTFTVRIPAVA